MPNSPKGIFLGLTTIDLQYLVASHPKPNSKNKALEHEVSIGGPAINAAATFVHLGGKAQTYSVVGQHPFTNYIQAECHKYQLNLLDLAPNHPHLPTLAAVWTSQENGDRSIITNRRTEPQLTIPQFEHTDIILVDGFHMEAAIHLARWGRAEGIPVVMDGGSWKAGTDELLNYVDMAICSNDFRLPDPHQNVFEYFRSKGVKSMAITNGSNPIIYQTPEESGEILPQKMDAVDTLGAGDVFHGAFCFYYANKPNFKTCLRQAAIIAGRSCAFIGAKKWME